VGVHRNDVVCLRDTVQPRLDLVGLFDILLTRDLDASLDLFYGHGRQMQRFFRTI